MEKVRNFPEQQAWTHGPVGLCLQAGKLYVFTTNPNDTARLNAEISSKGVRMLVGRRSSLLRALLALTLEDPPATLAAVATSARAFFAAAPVVGADGAAEDAIAAPPAVAGGASEVDQRRVERDLPAAGANGRGREAGHG